MDKIKTYNTLVGPVREFNDLLGRTLFDVKQTDDELLLYLTPANYVRFYHQQDCCESVYIEDVCGDFNDLIGEPLTCAEQVSDAQGPRRDAESYTWTFYRFATRLGSVTVRWFGSSNGYYSERVSVEVVSSLDSQ